MQAVATNSMQVQASASKNTSKYTQAQETCKRQNTQKCANMCKHVQTVRLRGALVTRRVTSRIHRGHEGFPRRASRTSASHNPRGLRRSPSSAASRSGFVQMRAHHTGASTPASAPSGRPAFRLLCARSCASPTAARPRRPPSSATSGSRRCGTPSPGRARRTGG